MDQPKYFEVKVRPTSDSTVLVSVNGEEHESDGFEFSAPFGAGLRVRKITRIELEEMEPPKTWPVKY